MSMDHILLLPPSTAPPPARFRLVRPGISLGSYQLYAVERWIASRDRHPLLVVYTGHADHAVVLDAYAPHDQPAWDDALAALRAHGARPKNTPHGTLMLTSLAHFRSDYTIVPIPAGDYLAVQDQLYANINLLRMGCSGRSALTLEDPSETTKDRFISAYHLPESTVLPCPASTDHLPISSPQKASRKARNQSTSSLLAKTKDRPAFVATVLELVKLVQAALAMFGMYPIETTSVSSSLVLDGLLCDTTVQGINLWTSRVGAPCVGLQPTDRVVDPPFVAALLSLVLATRNKLAYLGYSFLLPRDPFLYPHAFSLALATYLQSTAPPAISPLGPSVLAPLSHHGSVYVSAPLIPPAPPANSILSAAAASAAAAALPVSAVLTRDTVDAIAAQHEQRIRTESRKVRHVLKGKRASLAAPPGFDSDGADVPPERIHPLSLTLSLSGGEEALPPANAASPSASSSKSQLLSGLASGLRGGSAALANVGVNVGGGAVADGLPGDPGAVIAPTRDLAAFVQLVAGTGAGRTAAKRRGRTRRARHDSIDFGAPGAGGPGAHPYLAPHDAVVGASVRALWGGRVGELVRMREEVGAQHDTGEGVTARRDRRRAGVASDGEESGARSYDGRSTEEESDVLAPPGATGAFGGMWGGRVRGKLGTWAGGLSRKKHHSVDLGGTSPPGPTPPSSVPLSQASSQHSQLQQDPLRGRPQPGRLVIGGGPTPSMSRRASAASRAQSPTLPPMVFSLDMDREPDDDDLLSSGQVSPLSDERPNPFNALSDTSASLAGASTTLAGLAGQPHRRRPRAVQSARGASWAGPRGEDEDADGMGGAPRSLASDEESDVSRVQRRRRPTQARFHSLLSVVDGAGVRGEAVLASASSGESEDEDGSRGEDGTEGYLSDDERTGALRRQGPGFDPQRRRSFHDMDTYRGTPVLAPERMALDVALCGELLTMWRREEHLRNVAACVQLLSASLAQTNTGLRAHHDAHAAAIRTAERRARVLAALDTAHAAAHKLAQATNTLDYESAQFRVDDLWAAARPPRRTVLDLRARVFGAGGRRLRAGVHGAHGPYNRLQRTLDGRARLVDHLGRTESEAEEERALEQLSAYLDGPARAQEAPAPADDEAEVVAHPGIKPMWLLRFFTSWGARWSAAASAPPVPVVAVSAEEDKDAKPPTSEASPVVNTEKIPRPASR